MAETAQSRGSKACSYCHAKKTRCVFEGDNPTCRACKTADIDCIPRNRKKRRTMAERTPSLIAMPTAHHGVRNEQRGQSPSSNSLSLHTPGTPLQPPECNEVSAPDLEFSGSAVHTYMGRAHYIRDNEEINEVSARSFPATRLNGLSHLDMSTIAAYNGFHIPSQELRQEYSFAFQRYCSPWMPIMHQDDINAITRGTSSPLLSQAFYVAASRVLSKAIPDSPSTGDFYQRAKILFWMGHENSPLVAIKASLMMQWYNPEGPEHVSLDTSEFWLRTGIGLAYQVGLHKEPLSGPLYAIRRRLWWSLVARDSLIAASHGRPRAINMDDCEVAPPKPSDIHENEGDGTFFVRYISICRILGDLTECCCRNNLSNSRRFETESALIRWLEELPPRLRILEAPQDADFNLRQLHLPYLMSVMVLSRFHARGVSRTAVLAASTCAGIFSGFLARNEIQVLAPVFTIYCIGAGFSLLTLYPYPDLWLAAQDDLTVILDSLSELSKRWRSAIGGLKAVRSAMATKQRSGRSTPASPLNPQDPDNYDLMQYFPTRLCRLRTAYESFVDRNREVACGPSSTSALINNQVEGDLAGENTTSGYPVVLQPEISPTFAWMQDSPFESSAYEHFGNWLLNEPSIAALGGA